MKRSLILILCLLLVAVMISSCNHDAPADRTLPVPSKGLFRVGNKNYSSLEKAVLAIKNGEAKNTTPTIYLMGNVVDSGAVIDTSVNLDFGGYTYTLQNSESGITIKGDGENPAPLVSVTGGSFKASTGNTLTALFNNVDGTFSLSNTTVNLVETDLNAIETASTTNINDNVTIIVSNNIVKATGGQVTVDSSATNVELTGSFYLSGNAQVALNNSSLNLAKKIAKEGEASITIGTYVPVQIEQGKIVSDYAVYTAFEPFTPTPATYNCNWNSPAKINFAPSDLKVSFTTDVDYEYVVYQWYRADTAEMTEENQTIIEGATSNSLSLANLAVGDHYFVRCAVNTWDGSNTWVYSGVAEVANTGLPTVYINMNTDIDVSSDDIHAEYYDGIFTLVSLDGKDDIKTVDDEGVVKPIGVSVKGRGNSSWLLPKKGYNIKLTKGNGGEKYKTEVLGMKAANKWSLIANYADKSLMRNWVSKALTEVVMGTANKEWNPSYKYVDFVINGNYVGNYVVVEPIEIGKSRYNINSIEKVTDPEKFETEGGFIVEIDTRKKAGEFFFTTSIYGIPFSTKDPDLDKLSYDAKAFIRTKINAVEAELDAPEFASKPVEEFETIDVASFVDWYIVEEIAKSIDNDFWTSVYVVYNPKDGKIHMGPHWDFDTSMGRTHRTNGTHPSMATKDGDVGAFEDFWINKTQSTTWTSWYQILLTNDSFINAIKTRWQEVYSRFDSMYSAMDDLAVKLQYSAALNFRVWNILGNRVGSREAYRDTAALPGKHYKDYASTNTYSGQVELLKEWLQGRTAWLNEQWGN